VKNINENMKYIQQDLNPMFYRSYELDVEFPEDYRLEIKIFDKGGFLSSDNIIGSTVVDLENRYNGVPYQLVKDGLEVHKTLAKEKIKKVERAKKVNKHDKEILD
jgi:hypothetical protein